eukprot:TRINITY_DN22673_c0_g1_i1.p1 TRINITY_DN22673_c0_g1~~TRINITY_DN22673_c0_g1_i1.p1  ORF type:complete len:401 (+),score=64.03 TRINITY_DN22673_c0_g1_i1:57-1259(+)
MPKVAPNPEDYEASFKGEVLIIGAGVAGLTAGYLLKQKGIDFQIIEASSCWGGRIKDADGFADFPVAIGAEWVHARIPYVGIHDAYCPIFKDITDSECLEHATFHDIIEDLSYGMNGKVKPLGKCCNVDRMSFNIGGDYKFHNSSWVNVFDNRILPSVKDFIIYDSPVKAINYESDKVTVKVLAEGSRIETTYQADKVLVCVPIFILQKQLIGFTPPLAAEKAACIAKQVVSPGLKLFMEFKEKFYPHMTMMDRFPKGIFHMYFDEAVGKSTQKHILCLVLPGPENYALATAKGDSDTDIRDFALGELDKLFDGNASKHLIQFIVQDWTKEPHILGAIPDIEHKAFDPKTLAAPVDSKVYFAGDAYNPVKHNNEYVQGACETAYIAVKEIATSPGPKATE